MRRPIGLFCAVLCVLGLTAIAPAAAQAATPRSPGAVTHLHGVSHSSASVTLSWTRPAAGTYRSTVVRYAGGTHAPRSVRSGHSAARLGRTAHRLTVHRLHAGQSYAFSVFALDAAGRAGARVSTVVAVAPAPVTALSSFAASASSQQLTWSNPRTRSFARAVVRVAKGAAAPTTPSRGHSVRVSSARGKSATLTGLARDTTYAVSVWALDRTGGYSTPSVARFTTSAGREADGTLVGVVRDSAGAPLSGVEVSAAGDNYFSATGHAALTGPDGTFHLSVRADSYTLFVDGDDIHGGNSDDTGYVGTVVTADVRAAHVTTVPPIQLAPGAAITGRIVDAAGKPLAGAYPYAVSIQRFVDPDTEGDFFLSTSDGAEDSRPTGADGTFVLRGVPTAGAVRVCADPSDAGHSSACAGRTIVAGAGSSRAVGDLALPTGAGGTLTGTVRGSDGSALGSTYVTLEGTDNSLFLFEPTDAQGRYEIDDVLPGSYHVCAQSLSTTTAHPAGFAPGCSAHAATVRAGLTTSADVVLPLGAALTGTVTGPTGKPVAGVNVSAQSRKSGASDLTNAKGQYTLTGLAAGAFQVCFATDGATGSGLATGVLPVCWRHGAKAAATANRVRSGIDVQLARGGAVSGTVLDAHGAPAAFVQVNASSSKADADEDDGPSAYAQTDAAGHYTVRGLPAGTYDLCFDSLTASGTDLTTCNQAAVTVRIGHTTTGADGRLRAVSGIAVTVRDADGNPVAGVDAVALSACPDECDPQPLFDPKAGVSIDASQATDSAGTALLDGILPGTYAVCLYAFNGTTSTGGSATGYADACTGTTFTVTVTKGQLTPLPLTLGAGGAVSGTVTDAAMHPVAGVRALVSNSGGTDYTPFDEGFGGDDDESTDAPQSYGYSAADGSYTAIGVQPGAQTVCFDAAAATGPNPTGYLDSCPPDGSAGRPVTVTAGSTTVGVDVSLAAAGGISGTVRHGTTAVAGVTVIVFTGRNVNDVAGYETTGADGSYTVGRLAPGEVTVCFGKQGLHAECWKDVAWDGYSAPPLEDATAVTVTAAAVTGGIDPTLR